MMLDLVHFEVIL